MRTSPKDQKSQKSPIRERLRSAHLVRVLLPFIMIGGSAACGGDLPPESVAEEELGGGETITIWTDRTELSFVRPAMIAGAPGGVWDLRFTDITTFQAVTEGRLTLEFQGPDGLIHTTVEDAPVRAGVYNPAPTLPTAGMYDLVVILEGTQVQDEIFVGPIQVFGSVEDIPRLPEAESVGISFLKEQQWPTDFATIAAAARTVWPGLEVTGVIEAAPGRLAEVTAPVAGIVRWDLNHRIPTQGMPVHRGEVLAQLSPVGGEGTFASMQSNAARLEREVARAERLVAAEAIPARRLEEARHDLEVVRAQLDAMDARPGDGYVLALTSPIDGVVLERTFIPGQRVEAGTSLLRVLDPREFLLKLHVPAAASGRLDEISGATFTPEGARDVKRTTRMVSVGAALDPIRHTIPVTFLVDNADGALRLGMLVTGRILSATPEPTLAVPSTAVRDEDGLLVVYVQISGETFERRAVTVGATDGQWTTLLSGVRLGERVVIRGQYQIKLSSLNTSEISDHGHPH